MFSFLRPSSGQSPQMTAAEAVRRAATGEIVLIDVRDPGELRASGKAKDALNLPLAALRMKADPRSPECLPDLKSGKPLVLYCASGARSGMAAQMLKSMGHPEVHNIGGFGHWCAAGGLVDR